MPKGCYKRSASTTQMLKDRFIGINKGRKGSKNSQEQRDRKAKSKMGDLNPAKRLDVRKKISDAITKLFDENPEYKVAISKSMKKYLEEHPEVLENRKAISINQFSDKFTDIEEIIANELDKIGWPYQHNCKIGKYFPDFVIGDIIIECDGEYWHKDISKEAARDTYLKDRGYKIHHLKGKTIFQDPSGCIKNIVSQYAILFYYSDGVITAEVLDV